MAQNNDYDKTNTGALFVNRDKKKLAENRDTSKWADRQGKINIYGIEFYINGWIRKAKSGDNKGSKFMSISLTPVDEDQCKKFKKAADKILGKKTRKSDKISADEAFDNGIDDDLPF